jgi:putative oxidoreductase
MAFYHGWGKLSGYADQVKDFPDPLGIGGQYSLIGTIGAEFVCAIMILIGLMTRWASIGLLFTMGVAAFIFHKSVVADIELPLIYFLSALCLIFTGAGKLSVDALIYKS